MHRLAAVIFLMTVSTVAADPPGVIIDTSPDPARVYIGSPSLAVLPDGDYVASHDFFGPGTGLDKSVVFGSGDRGKTWRKLAELDGQWWSTLFVHKGYLYIIGTSRAEGSIVIRRSRDGGKAWTAPKDKSSGLLRDDAKYHCAPVPLLRYNDRLWRAFELVEGGRERWSALVISVPLEADLLKADNWLLSEPLQHLWSASQWIEGNVLITPDGKLVNILRSNLKPAKSGQGTNRAAIVNISDDGRKLTHERDKDSIDFPGGEYKFTIRFDPKTKRYWSLVNQRLDSNTQRNILALSSSADLRNWKVESFLLRHADSQNHAWQYVDWLFDGDDIIAVSRTAWDGSHNFHDANFMTFHRFKNFRTMTMADSPPYLGR